MHDIETLVRNRFSPKAFAPREVDDDILRALFEAARWAPSCYNDQPWHFVVTRRGETIHAALLECLATGNQAWAGTAPLLLVGVAREHFAHNGTANRHAWYDLGQAVASLLLVATSHGLHVHQMAGFDAERTATLCALPTGHAAVVVAALGYLGDPARLPPGTVEKDPSTRERKALADFVFAADWGTPCPSLAD
ncbi:MAG: nitroreductase family protein [Gammaproteobacteria bacterium]